MYTTTMVSEADTLLAEVNAMLSDVDTMLSEVEATGNKYRLDWHSQANKTATGQRGKHQSGCVQQEENTKQCRVDFMLTNRKSVGVADRASAE